MQSFQEQDYTKRFDLSLWRKLIKVAKPYHKNLIAVVLFMAVSAIIDVIMPNMNAYAIDVFIANHSTAGLVGFVVAYALLTAVQVATIFGFLRQCGIVETGTCYLIRKLGFQKLQELPFSYYDRMPVGYLMSRLTNDAQRLADTIGWSLVDLCWGAVYLVACAVRMLTINWRLGLIVMLVLPPLAVISWKFQKAILAAYRQVRKNNSQITAGFNEGINGDTTGGMLARMQGGVLAELREGGLGADRPYALLMGGSNDVFYSGSDAAAQENMGAMIHQLFSVGVLPVVGIPLPADAPHAPRAILKRRSGR